MRTRRGSDRVLGLNGCQFCQLAGAVLKSHGCTNSRGVINLQFTATHYIVCTSLMGKIKNSIARILLFGIALFFIGPQVGSLDTDGDGVPDVPVIAVDALNTQNPGAAQRDGQVSTRAASGSLFLDFTNKNPGLEGTIVTQPRLLKQTCIPPLIC